VVAGVLEVVTMVVEVWVEIVWLVIGSVVVVAFTRNIFNLLLYTII
jgi:hypothetical protein